MRGHTKIDKDIRGTRKACDRVCYTFIRWEGEQVGVTKIFFVAAEDSLSRAGF
jgi:hypothetical protein